MNYSLFDPTGNITLILTGYGAVSPEAAAEAMVREPSAEQAGFLFPGSGDTDGELRMAGGEFCGNASMSAAARLAMDTGMRPGEKRQMALRVSGAEGIVRVELEALTPSSFRGRVAMPRIGRIEEISLSEDHPPVQAAFMPGIVHAAVPESFGIERAEALLPGLCEHLGAEAMGLMLTDPDLTRITPVVYVPGAGTLVREHSCASGTSAVGAILSFGTGAPIRRSFREPGGALTVEAHPDGRVFLEGTVSLIKTV